MSKRTLFAVVFLISSFMSAPLSMAQTPDVEPDHVQPTLGGDAAVLLPEKSIEEVSVVAFGSADSAGILPFVLRNDSQIVASDLLVKVEVKDAAGVLLGVGTTMGAGDIAPNVMNPGDVALGYIFLDGNFPADADYKFILQPSAMGIGSMLTDIEFQNASWNGSSVLGELVNPTGKNLTMITLITMCFTEEGTPTEASMDFVMEPVGPGAVVTFQAGMLFFMSPECDAFLVAGTGM